MKERKIRFANAAMLLLAAIIWGVAFVAQSVGMDYVQPFTFNCSRFFIGSAVLVPVILIKDRSVPKKAMTEKEKQTERKVLLIGGILCGIAMAFATSFQQFGIMYTSVGKAGFITACYIVLVPVLGLFLKKRPSPLLWIAVLLAVIGLYLLCITEGFSIGQGDILVMCCALIFSIHILIVDYFSPKTDGVKLSCLQFLFSGILCGICMLLFEHPTLSGLTGAAVPILYAGVMSCGIAYTLQIVGQKNTDPTIASLLLSMESCVSVIAGWLILGQALSLREILGCVIMFAAIILAQI